MPNNQTSAQATSDPIFRSRLAQRLTTGALIFVGIVAAITLSGAGLNALIKPDEKNTALFFDMAKYILATVLPVVAGWVGTVLAFYFGKENFEAGTRSVADAAKALTSKEKLATTVVGSLGKARSDFKALVFDAEQSKNPGNVDLEKIKNGFADETASDKLYERLPVLLVGDVPYMVLHRSTLNAFLVEAKGQEAKDFKLNDLFKKVDYLPQNSFVTVGPQATAALAKTEIEKIPNCSDVFVTVDGKRSSAVTRWITNVDLLNAAEI